VVVASRLGSPDEQVVETDVARLAEGAWDPVSVVLVLDGPVVQPTPVLAWGRDESAFERRAGLVTKAEVRAVALGKLGIPATGVLWDVGAGSGSVAVESALLAPRLRVLAVERRADDAARIRANCARAGVPVEVVEGEAPGALVALPDPDRLFVGGGGLDVLDAALTRLRPGGRMVATYACLDRAVGAFQRLGAMVQLGVGRARTMPGGGVRLAGENPVFVAWGPQTDRRDER
jgi:precorrin-6Y C5,15-methyltransferase (decarboxylating)